MKNPLLYLFIVFLIISCGSGKSLTEKDKAGKQIQIQTLEEGDEYVLLTFDNEFEKWFEIHENSAEKRDLEYYKNWNIRYVNDWNIKSRSPSQTTFFAMILDFDPFHFNDLKLQRKLFMYFQYVEVELKQKILYGSGPDFVI